MRKFKTKFPEYVAFMFKARLLELGISGAEFVRRTPNTNHPTLHRILHADGSTNIHTLAHYAEALGLEIIIRNKQEQDNENSN